MTTYSFGGTPLASLGRVTMMDDYIDTAERRGGNVTIPYEHGSTFVEKYYDERVITFGLAVDVASATALEARLDMIKRLTSVRTQGTLSMTMEDTTVRTTLATIDSPFQASRKKDSFLLSVLEFRLTQPYFRSSVQTLGTATMSAGTVALNLVNPGTIEETNPTITLIGPLNNVVATNSLNGFTFSYAGTIPAGAGGTVTVRKSGMQYVATDDLGANKIGNITHTGGAEFMRLNAGGTTNGTNAMSIVNAGGTTGKVIFSFFPPYL